jgi:hypothetical protein
LRLGDVALAAVLSLYSISTTAESKPAKPVISYFFAPSQTGNLYQLPLNLWKDKLGEAAEVKAYCTMGDKAPRYDRWYCGFKLGKNAESSKSFLKIMYHTEDVPAVFVENNGKSVRVKSNESLCEAVGRASNCLD